VLFFNTFQKVINGVDWLVDHHALVGPCCSLSVLEPLRSAWSNYFWPTGHFTKT